MITIVKFTFITDHHESWPGSRKLDRFCESLVVYYLEVDMLFDCSAKFRHHACERLLNGERKMWSDSPPDVYFQ